MKASVTDRYCVMGHPVEHSKSPWIHARFAQLAGEDVEYTKRLVPLGGFAEAVEQFRFEGGRGCNVTVPFKFEAAALATRLSARAALAGACNTLKFEAEGEVFGDNTDGAGLVNDLQRNARFAIAGRDVLVVGAGGAAAGLLGPFIEARPRSLKVANRTVAKARALCDRHAALASEHGVALACLALNEVRAPADLVVNATASSMSGDMVSLPHDLLRPGSLAVDLMYGPAAAAFLAWATSCSANARDGLGMLVEQAAAAFELWRGVRPDAARVLAELRALPA